MASAVGMIVFLMRMNKKIKATLKAAFILFCVGVNTLNNAMKYLYF